MENEDRGVHRKGQDGAMVWNLYNSQLFLRFHDAQFIIGAKHRPAGLGWGRKLAAG